MLDWQRMLSSMPSKLTASENSQRDGAFSGIVGLFLALVLLKLGNPVIMDDRISSPTTFLEFVLGPWPMRWGFVMLGLVLAIGLRYWKWPTGVSRCWTALPAIWLGWQFVSAVTTVDARLTRATLPHFAACTVLFYFGLAVISNARSMRPLWIGLVGGLLVVFVVGWRQHFGGLEDTRQFLRSLPNWQNLPKEFLDKVASDRIYSTLVYPNTLAGVVVLLSPLGIVFAWNAGRRISTTMSWFASGGMTALGVGCLYWSGSKGGWIIAIIQMNLAIFSAISSRRFKMLLIVAVFAAGVGGFWLKHMRYFENGASSARARTSYWTAALVTLKEFPITGSGPGTFMIRYQTLKSPEAEMTRLAHNDFLQQGSDSGWIGLLSYSIWFTAVIIVLYRNSFENGTIYSVWLGLLGVFIQGFVEFSLYVPALSWVTFLLAGWLWAATNQIDKPIRRS
jgi:O-antigen ligase